MINFAPKYDFFFSHVERRELIIISFRERISGRGFVVIHDLFLVKVY